MTGDRVGYRIQGPRPPWGRGRDEGAGGLPGPRPWDGWGGREDECDESESALVEGGGACVRPAWRCGDGWRGAG